MMYFVPTRSYQAFASSSPTRRPKARWETPTSERSSFSSHFLPLPVSPDVPPLNACGCSCCRSGCTVLTTAAVTTVVMARRCSSPTTSTPGSVLETRRPFGRGQATWVSSAAPSSQTLTGVGCVWPLSFFSSNCSRTAVESVQLLLLLNREARCSVRGGSSGGGHGAQGDEVPSHRHRDLCHPSP